MKHKHKILGLGLCAAMAILAAGMAVRSHAEATGSSDNWPGRKPGTAPETAMSLYDQGVRADKAGDDKAALQYFRQALAQDRKNPEIINMLAHSERKLGMLNEAILDYWKALRLRPRFPEAREYLGEAYIQAALAEIATLKSYGEDGEEQREDLIKAFKAAAAGLEAEEARETAK